MKTIVLKEKEIKNSLRTQIGLFLLIGGTGLLAELSILKGLTHIGVFYLIAELFGGAVSVLINYFGLRTWAFKTSNPPSWPEFGKYVGSVSLMIVLGFLFLILGVELLKLEPVNAKIVSVPFLACISFIVKKKLVFRV